MKKKGPKEDISGDNNDHEESDEEDAHDQTRKTPGGKLKDDEAITEWKKLLRDISNDKTEEIVQKKVDEFMVSQQTKKLKYLFEF